MFGHMINPAIDCNHDEARGIEGGSARGQHIPGVIMQEADLVLLSGLKQWWQGYNGSNGPDSANHTFDPLGASFQIIAGSSGDCPVAI